MAVRFLSGLDSLTQLTDLLRRVRQVDLHAGVYEAADFHWWWRTPRSTDHIDHLFWVDEESTVSAAAILTEWKDSVGLDVIVLPDAPPDRYLKTCERGLAHARSLGYDSVDFVVDRTDAPAIGALATLGFTELEREKVDAWMQPDQRPSTTSLPAGYRLVSRADLTDDQHHLSRRNGSDVERRLLQTSLYRSDLDLAVIDARNDVVAYGLFWFDPVTQTGLVEPMRTEDEHQNRGLGRHILTAGLNRLFGLDAQAVKIACDPSNAPAYHLYTTAGFKRWRECVFVRQK